VRRCFIGAHHRHRQVSQFILDHVQDRRSALRVRQAQQRHHAVGFDFEQSLHQPSRLQIAQAHIAHHKPRKAVRLDQEIRVDFSALQEIASDDHRTFEQSAQFGLDVLAFNVLRHEGDMAGHHDFSLQAKQPLLRDVHKRHLRKRLPDRNLRRLRLRKHVAREFRMAFPFQAETSEVMEEMLRADRRAGDAEMRTQFRQDRVLAGSIVNLLRVVLRQVYCEMRERFRSLQAHERP
jgi:hypothetical protein